MTKLTKKIMAVSMPALLLAACTKDPLDYLSVDDTRIYTTDYDSTTDFTSFKTYSISDSVTYIDNGVSTKELAGIDVSYIDAVDEYMQQRGYTKVKRFNNPDLGININRIYSTETDVIDYTTYWSFYGGYWDPYYWGYGGYDYGYPYGYGSYSYTTAAESIDMLDLKNAAANGQIDIIWTGLVRGQEILDTANADDAVEALFNQSPYLQSK